MSDYASNTPVSRPRNVPWEAHWDCNALMWSNDYGFFFKSREELSPLRRPPRVTRRGQ